MQALSALVAWCLAHPLIVWPVVTFVVTAVFGEADKYAATHPGFARVLALLNAAGVSAPGLLKAIKGKLVPPAVTLMLAVSVGCALVSPLVVACSGSGPQFPARDTARASVLLLAEGVKQADHVCADVALAKKDAKIAKTCADAYDTARAELLSAESIVDAWTDAQARSYICALGRAVAALKSGTDGAVAAGATLPPVVVDALSLAGGIGKECTQ